MKYLICFFIALLFSTSVISAQTIPRSVLSQIKQDVEARYPDDYEMQEYLIKKQVKAFHAVQSYTAEGIPKTVIEKIINKAISKYPVDYEMQEYLINNQVESYRRMKLDLSVKVDKKKSKSDDERPLQTSVSRTIPTEILEKIKAKRAIDFPDNYSMQRIMVNSVVFLQVKKH
jgi:hypothetical protein